MLSKTFAKYIQSLHHKKFRDAEQAFIAEGPKVVMELIHNSSFTCIELVGLEAWLLENESALRKKYKGPVHKADLADLEKISALSTPNQVLAIFKKKEQLPPVVKGNLILLLDTIQDPGNLGTLIRIADWFGIRYIVCSADSADMYNPKVVQSTMGSIGRVELFYTEPDGWLEENPAARVYASALAGKDIGKMHGIKEGVIIIGNESKGIRPSLMERANEKITIPRIGSAESLNAAVAAGIILSHITRQ